MVKGTIGRPTGSTNLGPWGLTETELPTKEHARVRPRPPCTLVADMHLGLHERRPIIGVRLTLTLLLPLLRLTGWASEGEDELGPAVTSYPRVGG